MKPRRFDALTRSFATRLSRRAAVQTAGLGLAATALGATSHSTAAQNATPTASDAAGDTFFLFVQTATSGSFTPNPGAGTPEANGTPVAGGGADYLLTLDGHPGGTVYFSDRPDRIFGEAPTAQFLDGLGFQPENPPNAALVTQAEDGSEDVVVLELLTPTYDQDSGAITYGATILDEYAGAGLAHVAERQQDAALPDTFGRASLFIDDCPDTHAIACMTDCFTPVGNIGEQGQCWDWSTFSCDPCADLNQKCNAAFPSCNGGCFANLGGCRPL